MTDANRALWNARAQLGATAGTRDLIAAELERRYIAGYVQDGMRVLDVGCGTGETLIGLAERFRIQGVGIDYAEAMAIAAVQAIPKALAGRLLFYQANVLEPLTFAGYPVGADFDLAYSARCLINLPDWPTQQQAIRNVLALVKPTGIYLMVECSADGLAETNQWRQLVGLPAIKPPFHNRYLHEPEVLELAYNLMKEGVISRMAPAEPVAATYTLLSRVVNAYLAQQAGVEPAYDSPINALALSLPNVGTMGQNRAWVWRRAG